MYMGIDQTRQDIAVRKIHDPDIGICLTQFLKAAHLLNPASFQDHPCIFHLHGIGIIDSLSMNQHRYHHIYLLCHRFRPVPAIDPALSFHRAGRHALHNVLLE